MKILKTTLCLLLCGLPFLASADSADNILIEPGAHAVALGRVPVPGMKITPGIPPNATLAPFRASSHPWPAYLSTYRTVRFILAISCGSMIDEPCRRPLVRDFSRSELTIAFVQTSDVHFTTEEGLKIGDTLNTVMQKIAAAEPWYTGDGECIRLPSGWNACFYVDDLVYDPNGQTYRPRPEAKIFRFLKDFSS